uniref:Uncharacterized protein n=1 Tax=Romanomermis culicivorax TaxID=13658 RepID=A0A915JC05_ROMCU
MFTIVQKQFAKLQQLLKIDLGYFSTTPDINLPQVRILELVKGELSDAIQVMADKQVKEKKVADTARTPHQI